MIDHLVGQGVARSSPTPQRPPEPDHDRLVAVNGRAVGYGGSVGFVVMFEDDPDADEEAFLMADPDDVVDVRGWR